MESFLNALVLVLILLLSLISNGVLCLTVFGNSMILARMCNGTDKIVASYNPALAPVDDNKYQLRIYENLIKHSQMEIKFNRETNIVLLNPDISRMSTSISNPNTFDIRLLEDSKDKYFSIKVQGTTRGVFSYPTSININNEEYCEHPKIGALDGAIQGTLKTDKSIGKKPSTTTTPIPISIPTCGRRQIDHTELIANSQPTKPGDWPWHVALYRFEKVSLTYKCGGTLISKNVVVTAAHCTTIRGAPLSPEVINVVLGKYNLIGGDIGAQEKEVHEIKVHEKFNPTNLDNDISMLKLKSEATFGDYVQPACIWNPQVLSRIDTSHIYGTVVGWGFDNTDQLSTQLRQATMPKVSESKCLKSNPLFFGRLLTEYKFCAGFKNGTSACNGDSGGGFVVFVPDEENDDDTNVPGSWYIRGIVSVGVARKDVAICDSNQYVLFTNLAKYRTWMEKYIN